MDVAPSFDLHGVMKMVMASFIFNATRLLRMSREQVHFQLKDLFKRLKYAFRQRGAVAHVRQSELT